MIIGCDVMVQLGLSANFKHQFLQWDGVTVPMKAPSCLLGKSDIKGKASKKLIYSNSSISNSDSYSDYYLYSDSN